MRVPALVSALATASLVVACSSASLPTAQPTSEPTAAATPESTPAATPEPTATATAEPTAATTPERTPVANAGPPTCSEPDLVWHATLQQLVMVNCASGNESVPLTLWAWDGQTWQELPAADRPAARVLGGAAYDVARDRIVAYGGFELGVFECDQTMWEWDGATWTQIDTEPPPICHHFRMTYDEAAQASVIVGGQGPDDAPVNETWSWDGQAWQLLTADGPPSRAHFGFVHDPNHPQTLLYGGYDGGMYEDFWSLEGETWEQLDLAGPGTRSHFGMAYDTNADALYMYGGAETSSSFASLTDETWRLTGGAWLLLSTDNSPGVRGSAALAYDPEREVLVLYGGFNGDGVEFADTWEFDGDGWSCVAGC